ncbi:FAD-dependent oxidoreductase [Legionella hackeliae]|uniref:FAD-dependent oxidoreductase 2 FAD-binding domain-containing protein n=1 Tax=Legionella hackeliae TaxID=449 RepID=A0A0A8URR3_LEGHA|nr:FAD-binding protein [Legionella hackeliae]KTD13149.1 dihydropyrimidine dehydrogenase subunit A [Legionella hackeliae]CEK11540.1 protein of unknown function [Aromatic-ring hydroxylase-like] [Legionella hackeliae]STX48311.1 dihydropyrimidine dehydrogenase subunit A [Legionella hackeliae]
MGNYFDEEDTAADVAIVGLGPGGLAAALETAKQGKTVLVFTNREQYIRGQRLILSHDTQQFLVRYYDPHDPQDVKLWTKYTSEKTVQSKDIEKYLYRKLTKLSNVTIIKALPGGDLTIQQISKGIEGHADCIILKNGEKYYFRHLLGADGAKHSTADMVANCIGQPIQYKLTPTQERHPFHAVVQLQLKPGEKVKGKTTTDIIHEMQTLGLQGWKNAYHPKYYIFPNAAHTKFYFAGEIPQQIFDAPESEQKKQLKQWASVFLKANYGIEEEQLEYRQSKKTPSKDKLQNTVFAMATYVCETPLLDLSNGVFAQIGDARRLPNYNFAHGVNDSIKGALLFSQAMSSNPFSKEIFEKGLEAIDKSIEDGMQKFKQSKSEAREKAKKKLVKALDHFISLYHDDPESTPLSIAKIELAKQTFETTGELTSMYEALNEIKPLLEKADSGNIFYWAYTLINCCANSEAKLKTTIFEKITKHLESFVQEKISPPKAISP